MSMYGCASSERKHEKVLGGIKYLDDNYFYTDWDFPIRDLEYIISLYNKVRKPSRKVCRLRDVFYALAYNDYHKYTDECWKTDKEQIYNFGKMEIFV